jgi:hypothetical protein
LKKTADSVRFRFYKKKTEKTEPNRNQKNPEKKPSQNRAKPKKPSHTEKNLAKIEKTEPNRKT